MRVSGYEKIFKAIPDRHAGDGLDVTGLGSRCRGLGYLLAVPGQQGRRVSGRQHAGCGRKWLSVPGQAGHLAGGLLRLERLVHQRDLDRAAAQLRIDAQPPEAQKIAHADVVIDNSGTIEDTVCQVERAWLALTGKTGSCARSERRC